jgi:hypothetical protein
VRCRISKPYVLPLRDCLRTAPPESPTVRPRRPVIIANATTDAIKRVCAEYVPVSPTDLTCEIATGGR